MNKILIKILCMSFSFSAVLSATANEDQVFEISNSEIVTIESTILNRKYDLYIKVPRDYFEEKNQSKQYPVLYLNDGPHTFKVAAGVTHFPSMDKSIVVGISFAHGENGQNSRVRDFTPVVDKSWKKYVTGGATEYLAFIEREVFPFVEKNYRIDVHNRILSGHSLGGSFGAWVLLTKPSLFSRYILTSPSLWFKNDYIFDLENEFSKTNNSLNAKIFVATGALEVPENGMRNDMVDGHVRFIKRLRSRHYQGLYISDEIVEGTDHYSTFPVGLAKGLKLFYQEL
ncbi:alpha/beta hydrolase [Pseudomonas sp. HK3]